MRYTFPKAYLFPRLLFVALAMIVFVPGADAFVRTSNLLYQTPGNTTRNHFDLYTPNSGIRPGVPTILDLHGGGYTTGDKIFDQQVCGLVADRGFNVISMNYTLAVPGVSSSFPQTFRDVRAVIRWIRTTGVQWGLSPTIVITGQSAGCTIDVAVAYAPELPEFDPGLPPPPGGYAVDAVIGFFGRYDLVWDAQTFGSPQSVRNYLGIPITAPGGISLYAAASAMTYVNACAPPTKLIVGDQDGVVPIGNTTRLAAALTNAGVFNILVVVPGAGHGQQELGNPFFIAGHIADAIPVLLGASNANCGSLQPPINDDCASAIEIGPAESIFASNFRATADAAPSCGRNDTRDVWYHFVAPFARLYTFDTIGTTGLADTTLTIFGDCPMAGGTGTVLACDDDSGPARLSRVEVLLESGQSARIRIAGNDHAAGVFRLNVDSGVTYYAPPMNDQCLDGFPLGLGTTLGTSLGATGNSPGPCGAEDEKDVWYSFTPSASARYRFDMAGTTDIPVATLAVLASCTGPVIGCEATDVAVEPAPRFDATLVAGQLVLLRIAGNSNARGTFVVTITRLPAPTGACCNMGECASTDSDNCIGGIFFAGQACAAVQCQPIGQPPGACCTGPRCTMTDGETPCASGGGTFLGVSVLCGQPGNPTTCCAANFNLVGGISVQDIFDLLAAYFASEPRADFNASGTISVQDIFDFLSVYFEGC